MTDYTVVESSSTRTFNIGNFTISVDEKRNHVRVSSFDWKEICGEHYWHHHGTKSIWQFISGLTDRTYVEGKLFLSSAIEELDVLKTRKNLKDEIKRLLDEKEMNEDEYGEMDDRIDDIHHVDDCLLPFNLHEGHVVFKPTTGANEFWQAWCAFREYVQKNLIK
jgi:hypothetical protein